MIGLGMFVKVLQVFLRDTGLIFKDLKDSSRNLHREQIGGETAISSYLSQLFLCLASSVTTSNILTDPNQSSEDAFFSLKNSKASEFRKFVFIRKTELSWNLKYIFYEFIQLEKLFWRFKTHSMLNLHDSGRPPETQLALINCLSFWLWWRYTFLINNI